MDEKKQETEDTGGDCIGFLLFIDLLSVFVAAHIFLQGIQ